jgi:hypothetical protein
MSETNQGMTTEDMLSERLKVNLQRKAAIGDMLFKGGVPEDPKTIRLYLDVSRDEEATMLEMKKQKLEEERGESDDAYKAAMVDALRDMKKNRVETPLIEELPEDIVKEIAVLDTELSREKEVLALSDFVEE